LYGCLSNLWFPLFNESMAQAITGNGRYFIRKLSIYIENKLQEMIPSSKPYIIYNDTDAAYFQIETFMNMYQEKNPNLSMNGYVDWADSFEVKVIQPIIKQCISDFCNELNAYNADVIGAEREIIADAGIYTKKKKYYARVRDSEGTRYPEDDPYIKIMGLDAIKSSTPAWSKKKLNESIHRILDDTEFELKNWFNEIKQEFTKQNLNDIAIIGGVSNLDYNLGDKGVPFGSRSALVHNKYIKDNNLEDSIAPINAGDKCKRIFLLEPNKFSSNVIAFTNPLFINELRGIVDYDTQFEKGFSKLLTLMVDCLEYNLEKETADLDDW